MRFSAAGASFVAFGCLALATSPVMEAGETGERDCEATTIRGSQPQTLRFRLPICGPGPHKDLIIRSSHKITATRATMRIHRRNHEGEHDCFLGRERHPTGRQPVIVCPGYFGGFGGDRTVLGAFRIEGRRCDAITFFESNYYDCEPGIDCPGTGAPVMRRRVNSPVDCA